MQGPGQGMAQGQESLGPGDADEEQPALFLQVAAVLGAPGMGDDPLLDPDDHHRVELQALGAVQRHQRHGPGVLVVGVDVADQGDLLEIGGQPALGVGLGAVGVELDGGADELLDVLGRVGILLGGKGLLEPAAEIDVADDVRRRTLEALAESAEQGHEGGDLAGGRSAQPGDAGRVFQDVSQTEPAGLGRGLQPIHGRVADAASRAVDHPQQRNLVGGVDEKPQVGQHVLDLAAVEELHPLDDLVGHGGLDEGFLDHPAHGVGAVEDGDAAVVDALGLVQASNPGRDPAGFIPLVQEAEEPRRAPPGLAGDEGLVLAPRVGLDQLVGQAEHLGRRTEVLLQADDRGGREVPLEGQDVPDVGPPPAVDGLVGIAGYEQVVVAGGQRPGDPVLAGVGVLVFVHQEVLVAARELLPQLLVLLQEQGRADEQVVEVQGAGGGELLLEGGRRPSASSAAGIPARLRTEASSARIMWFLRTPIWRRTRAGG